MGWLPGLLGALAGAFLGGGLMFLTMAAREAVVVAGAVKVERDRGVVTCNARVGEIERAHNQAIADALEQSRVAAEQVQATPERRAEILALCKRSASCRERTP